jgi:hypothetical protein
MSNLQPDLDQARRYLKALDPNADTQCLLGGDDEEDGFTFQTFDDNKARKDRKMARVLNGTLHDLATTLTNMNAKGAGVFVTVNKTDMKGRTTENMKKVRAVWIDLVEPGIAPVPTPLKPHITVESSPGKFQFLFLVDGLTFEQHRTVQETLIAKYGSDESAKDVERVLRLPGFDHRKGEPKRTKLISTSDAKPYTAEQILAAFPPIEAANMPEIERRKTQIALVDYCEISAEDKDPCSTITLENVYQYLPDVTELSYQKWLNVGFMLHHQFEGSNEGKDVFDKWSSVSGHYDAAELDDKWDSCKPNKKNPLTMRSLIKAHNDKQAVEKLEAEKKAREQKAADDKKRDEEAMGKGKALLGECTSHIELMRAVAPAINTLANGNIALESDFRALLIARYIELNTDGKMTNGEATKAMKVNAAADRAAAKKAAKEAEKEAEKAKNIKRVTDKTGLVASSCFLPRGDNGKIIPYFTSVASALQIDNFTGYQLAYDDFLGEIVIRQKGEVWERFEDKHFGMLRFELRDAGFDEVSQQTVKEAIDFVVGYNHVDVAIDWLNSVVWDGVPRVAGFMHKYFKTENTPYASAVSKYIWSGLAGRILEPGCKLDMVPTFKSEQGKYKSTALQNMAPHPEYFVEIDFSKGDDDIVRKMRGKCVLEIAELKGLSTKDAEHIKGFITVRKDEWIPKYREFATKADRRSMFFGTTNQDEFLSDPTGNRRHLPIEVGNVDNDAILRDNNQLWAEGAVLFRESGVAWQDAIELAKPEVEKFEVKDVWQEAIQNWISAGSVAGIDEKLEATDFTTSNILTSAVGLVVSKQGRREQLRVSGIMEKLGYKKHQARVDAYGGRAYLWYLPCF